MISLAISLGRVYLRYYHSNWKWNWFFLLCFSVLITFHFWLFINCRHPGRSIYKWITDNKVSIVSIRVLQVNWVSVSLSPECVTIQISVYLSLSLSALFTSLQCFCLSLLVLFCFLQWKISRYHVIRIYILPQFCFLVDKMLLFHILFLLLRYANCC